MFREPRCAGVGVVVYIIFGFFIFIGGVGVGVRGRFCGGGGVFCGEVGEGACVEGFPAVIELEHYYE